MDTGEYRRPDTHQAERAMSDQFYNAVGLIGPALFMWAYAMLALGYWNGNQLRTHVPNLLGALCILVSLIRFWNLPIFVLEVCWCAISVYGIWRGLKSSEFRIRNSGKNTEF
jgi:hypothetical protein